jgi:hypothetical protein
MARLVDLGFIDGESGILHPKHKNRWKVTFFFQGTADSTGLTIQAIQCDRPKLSFEQITLDRYNSRAFIAGKHQFDPINITFEDDISGQATSLINSQLERQQRLVGAGGAPALPAAPSADRYKFGMFIEMLDGDYDGRLVLETWRIEGAYLENVDYTDLDYSASETVKITTTIRYDHASQIVSGRSGSATGGVTP